MVSEVALTFCSFLAVASGASLQPATHFVDLSHQHHLGPNSIAKAVAAAAAAAGGGSVSVDVSSTLLGDSGMSQVLDNLAEQKGGDSIRMNIVARTNHLTSSGATFIFNKLHDMSRPKNSTEMKDNDGDDEQSTSATVESCPVYVEILDISLNALSGDVDDRKGHRALTKSLQLLIEGGRCPRTLRLDCCELGPAACRAIGKGLLNAAEAESKLGVKETTDGQRRLRRLSSIYLSGNELIGDAGTAALAAALRTAPRSSCPLLEVLDLNNCAISDAGCEALAMAIRDNPGCVNTLNLSNNRITDDGAVSLGLAVSPNALLNIDLSNNKGVTDRGVSTLAAGMERGAIRSLVVRSCSIQADGAGALGKAICTLASSKNTDNGDGEYCIDLSGNMLGTVQVKKHKGSAGLLKSKASATVEAGMGFLGKKLRGSLKEAGFGSFVTVESDDDEEELLGDEGGDVHGVVAGGECGARAFSDAIIDDDGDASSGPKRTSQTERIRCAIGMRHCFLDERAADALAAAIVHARDKYDIDMSVDSRLNGALDDDVIAALKEKKDEELLLGMARRYFDIREALRIARQRAREAAEAASARARAENAFGSALGDDDFSDDYGGFGVYDAGGYEGGYDEGYNGMM